MNKVVLAYSGGLHTSFTPRWIKKRNCAEAIAYGATGFKNSNTLRLRTLASKRLSEGE